MRIEYGDLDVSALALLIAFQLATSCPPQHDWRE